MKTFQYRIYPSPSQKARMESVLETCRRFYNKLLAERKSAWEEEQRSIGKVEQLRQVKDEKRDNPFAGGIHSHVLQVVVTDLDKAFQAFFRRIKEGETPGYPRFRARHRFRSFGFKEYGNGFKVDGRRLKLSGIGRIAVRWHRPIEGVIKTVRIVCKPDGWYASFSCLVEPKTLPRTNREIGIDLGLIHLATFSDGQVVENPRWYRESQKKLRRLQRAVSRKTKGSVRRRKAVNVLARYQQHVANLRKDYLDKLSHGLVRDFDLIAIEDLKVKTMVRGHLSKSILDAGWGYLRTQLACKAENAGKLVVFVDPAYTSQDCCECGTRHDLKLSDRTMVCLCGNRKDRDWNASINVLQRAGYVRREPSSSKDGFSREAVGL